MGTIDIDYGSLEIRIAANAYSVLFFMAISRTGLLKPIS